MSLLNAPHQKLSFPTNVRNLLLFCVFVLFLVAPLHAQVQTGTPPFGSFAGGPDIINLANLNAHWDVPVLHKPSRGIDFSYDLDYDSLVWHPVTSGSATSWQPANNFGWMGQTQVPTGQQGYVEATSTTTTITCSCNEPLKIGHEGPRKVV